jgi:phosphohistidine phosphatase SixA
MNHVLYLVRHCQATGQEPDAPLTQLGQQQALVLADWLGEAQIERIVSSPFVRAYQYWFQAQGESAQQQMSVALKPTFRRCSSDFFISCEKTEPKSLSV